MITDYEQAGIPYDSPKVRIDRFVEGITVMKGAFAEGPFSFTGEHYTITGYDGLPQAGAAAVAAVPDRWRRQAGAERSRRARPTSSGINGNMAPGAVGPEVLATMTADSVDEKVEIVRQAAGDRFADIELNVRAFMVNVTDRAGRGDGQPSAAAIGYDRAMIEADPVRPRSAPRSRWSTTCSPRRERWGFSYVIVGQEDVEQFAPVVAALGRALTMAERHDRRCAAPA